MSFLEHFLAGNPSDIEYECVEVSHPAWIKVYRYVNNAPDGLTVKHTPAGDDVAYEYYPLLIERENNNEDLDQAIRVSVGDLGEDFPKEIDKIFSTDNYLQVAPTINYRKYLGSNLTNPIEQLLALNVTTYKPTQQGAGFLAQAREMNATRTGIFFTVDRFPTLIGFF